MADQTAEQVPSLTLLCNESFQKNNTIFLAMTLYASKLLNVLFLNKLVKFIYQVVFTISL